MQDQAESLAYFNSTKTGYLEKHTFDSKFHFSPKAVSLADYARIVCDTLAKKVQGKRLLVRGSEAKDAIYFDYIKDMKKEEYEHAKENVITLAQKYNSVHLQGYE